MKLEKRTKPEGKKLGKNAVKDLKAYIKLQGKDADAKDWSKAKTDVDLADNLREFCHVL